MSANWAQPTAHCGSAESEAGFWLGLDGIGSSTTEQTGTEMDCSGGQASYYGWYEMYPAGPVVYSNPVKPGDAMSASVTSTGSVFTLTLKDLTQAWTKKTTADLAGARLASAEVVAEVPTGVGSMPGNSVEFTGVTANGEALGSLDPQEIDSPGVTVSPIGTGESFSVSW